MAIFTADAIMNNYMVIDSKGMDEMKKIFNGPSLRELAREANVSFKSSSVDLVAGTQVAAANVSFGKASEDKVRS